MTRRRTPLFWVEIDASISIDGGQRIPLTVIDVELPALHRTNELATVGQAAKHLHALHHHDKRELAFVFRSYLGYYDFCFTRLKHKKDVLIATLTALTEHRVRVTYHNGRESETLYL